MLEQEKLIFIHDHGTITVFPLDRAGPEYCYVHFTKARIYVFKGVTIAKWAVEDGTVMSVTVNRAR